MQSAAAGNSAFQIWTIPPLPQDAVKGWQLVVNRGPNGGTSKYTLREGQGIWAQEGNAWSSDHTAEITLYRPYEDIAAEDARKPAGRSGACGSPNLEGLSVAKQAVQAESAEKGLWHCHGDGVYHRHPDWRYRHPAPGQAVRPTGDPVARPPATAPSSAADKAKGFGDWHSHPDGRFHRHAGGH